MSGEEAKAVGAPQFGRLRPENNLWGKEKCVTPRNYPGEGTSIRRQARVFKQPARRWRSHTADTRSHSKLDGDVFDFPSSGNETSSKSAAERDVLRTMSKMFLENRKIRKRLSQVHVECAESDRGQAVRLHRPVKTGSLQ